MIPTTAIDRLVEDWLASSAPAAIPSDLHAGVVGAARRTRQHRSRIGYPSGRNVLGTARLAIDLAAVLVLAVAAANLLPDRGSGGTPATATPPGAAPAATSRASLSSPPPEVDPLLGDYSVGVRHAATVDGIRFSFIVPAGGWEPYQGFLISKSSVRGQAAEGLIFWARFPDGLQADPCAHLTYPTPIGPRLHSLTEAVSTAPGVEVVSAARDLVLGGRAARHVVLAIREDRGCDPGYFYNWKAQTGGAMWPETRVGDTIRVWVVEFDRDLLFISALTNPDADTRLEQEIEELVESIQFE